MDKMNDSITLLFEECVCCGEHSPTIDMVESCCPKCTTAYDCRTCGVEYYETVGGNSTMCPACEFEQEMGVDAHQQDKNK